MRKGELGRGVFSRLGGTTEIELLCLENECEVRFEMRRRRIREAAFTGQDRSNGQNACELAGVWCKTQGELSRSKVRN